MAASSMNGYPVTFDVAYPEAPSRWLILVRWLLALPHYLVLTFLGFIAGVVWFVSFFTILFARTYPDSLYRFMVGAHRWSLNVNAYVMFLDRYPPFSMDAGEYEAVTFEVERPDFNRWLVLVKWLLVIPHLVVLTVLGIIAAVAFLVLALGVLVTGRYPRGLFDFLIGFGRWEARVNAYMLFLVDRYPPFSLR
ncbi:MAG: DUF4389 domain-containing protein [Chloroflexi bacterium]|nr:DUF4389 domain-containing protein [Chloroflexota bacterium]